VAFGLPRAERFNLSNGSGVSAHERVEHGAHAGDPLQVGVLIAEAV